MQPAVAAINIEAIGVFHDTAKLYVKNLNKTVKLISRYRILPHMSFSLYCHINGLTKIFELPLVKDSHLIT